MKKQQMDQNSKKTLPSVITPFGTNLIYYRNPKMVAWWAAALPGFGHVLLGQYIKGLILFLWEIVINVESQLNIGLVATLQGHFNQTKAFLDPVWILLYIPTYLFSIWDSYRGTIDINHNINLIKKDYTPFNTNSFGTIEVNVFTKKRPKMALFWSLLSPGAGQFYQHRLLEATFLMIWLIMICYFSHFFEGILYLLRGDLALSNSVFKIEWFMFLPSLFFFSAYNAYSDAIETNIFYKLNQNCWYQQHYQHPNFKVEFPKSMDSR